jgi:hypothetical protein
MLQPVLTTYYIDDADNPEELQRQHGHTSPYPLWRRTGHSTLLNHLSIFTFFHHRQILKQVAV